MENKFLYYLKNNDPEKVLSKSGIRIRKIINPAIRKIAPLTSKYKLKVERRAQMPSDKSIIYAPTHGFKDDTLFSIVTIQDDAYILFGSLPQFYNTFDGITAWLNGSIIVDRKDKESRKASKEKMEKAIEMGANLLLYPEGVWNKTQNLPMLKLYPGIYDVAKKTGAYVAPVATHLEGNKCYSILDEAFDISQYSKEEGLQILRDKMATLKWELMEKYSTTTRAQLLRQSKDGDIKNYWKDYLNYLISEVDYYDTEIENSAHYIDKNETNIEDAFAVFNNVEITKENAGVVLNAQKILSKNKENRYF